MTTNNYNKACSRLSEIEPEYQDRFLDGAEQTTSGGPQKRGGRKRRGAGYHIPTPVGLIFMFFIGVGATGATLYWMGAVDTASETSLNAQLLASEAKLLASRETANRAEAERLAVESDALADRVKNWQKRMADILQRYSDQARELDRQAIANEPEEAVLAIWLLRQILTSSDADLPDTPELLERYGHSRDSVIREIIGLVYPELPLGNALELIEQSALNNEELTDGNPG